MSGDGEFRKYDLRRLREELQHETDRKQMLEESVCDLRSTMCELQDRLHSVDGEGNEWKTRYETQVELNGQLDRQIALIHGRLEDLRGNPMDRLASIRSYDDMAAETLGQRLKLLSEEKCDLQTQLMDCHLQTQQEGKAFLKTNDERRAYLSEIAKLSSTMEAQRRQCSSQPQGAVESKPRGSVRQSREKPSSKNTAAFSKTGREEGGGRRGGGGGGGGSGAAAERREEGRSHRGSRLPSLKHLRHDP